MKFEETSSFSPYDPSQQPRVRGHRGLNRMRLSSSGKLQAPQAPSPPGNDSLGPGEELATKSEDLGSKSQPLGSKADGLGAEAGSPSSEDEPGAEGFRIQGVRAEELAEQLLAMGPVPDRNAKPSTPNATP
mmetsp:Transcript_17726/g.27414  ORF Transcript_17726/g.27414 Transcript_17726/m.27414 type:complete len:131 (-) Transcript_17726:62-454(-)